MTQSCCSCKLMTAFLPQVKCEQYWASAVKSCGDIIVKTTSEIILDDWTIKDFDIKNVSVSNVSPWHHSPIISSHWRFLQLVWINRRSTIPRFLRVKEALWLLWFMLAVMSSVMLFLSVFSGHILRAAAQKPIRWWEVWQKTMSSCGRGFSLLLYSQMTR